MQSPSSSKPHLIKTIYFYLVSLIGLLMIVLPTADLINTGLKTWVFPKANMNEYTQPPCAVMIMKDPSIKETEEQFQQRLAICEQGRIDEVQAVAIRTQKDVVRDLSFLLVGIPLFLYHWVTIRRDQKGTA